MKKFIFAACAAMVLFFGSCQKSAKQQAIDLINATTEKIEKAKTTEEAGTISIQLISDLSKLQEKYPELGKLDESDKDFKAAMDKLQAATAKFEQQAPAVEEQPAEPAADETAEPVAAEPTADENTAE
ncbi:MAG TPA: hypothetical protein DC009_06305 [Porphyromonadaceae bacterium]|nr:hypothetical protein [Porphyromonadaceae bacterium]